MFHGGVAHLGERLNGIQEVRGSIPLISTRNLKSPDFQGFFIVYFSKLSEQGERNKKPPALRVEGEKLKLQEAKPPW